MRRREALRRFGLAALVPMAPVAARLGAQEQGADTAAPEGGAPELYDPVRAGRPRDRITDYENDPFIIGIESRLTCTCGCTLDIYTCRTTDFTCGVSPELHRQVAGMVENGMTAQEVVDAFVAEHGEGVLMAPKKEGFNLLGYFVPGAAVLSAGAMLIWWLTRRREAVAFATDASDSSNSSIPSTDLDGLSEDEQERLKSEFEKLGL
jgi:cytochrome c-type biogenesis protein CcmH